MQLARRLQQASDAGAPVHPLRGKQIALLSHDPQHSAAVSFERAAAALGAHISRPALEAAGSLPGAMLWSRLYDAVACEGEGMRLATRIARDAGVPVFNGLASPDHPLATLAALLALQHFAHRPLQGMTLACKAAGASADIEPGLMQAALQAGVVLRVVVDRTQPRWPEWLTAWNSAARAAGSAVAALDDWTTARAGAGATIETNGTCPEHWHLSAGGVAIDPAAWRTELTEQRGWLLQAMLVQALA